MSRMLAALLLAAALPIAALAGSSDLGYRGWGPRIGISSHPDQVHIGAHLDFGEFAPQVRFQPNFEVGLGDGPSMAAFNFEAAYRFISGYGTWSPYAGGGLGLELVGGRGNLPDNPHSEIGASILGGIERGMANGRRAFIELKLGLADAPDLKLTTGWTFYRS
jgi:hypothetical protein